MSENIVIIAARLTVVGPFGGSLGPLDKVHGCGLKPVYLTMQVAACGDAQAIIDGGRGGMGRSTHVQARCRSGLSMGNGPLVDTTIVGGIRDAFNRIHRDVTDDNIAMQKRDAKQRLATRCVGNAQGVTLAVEGR